MAAMLKLRWGAMLQGQSHGVCGKKLPEAQASQARAAAASAPMHYSCMSDRDYWYHHNYHGHCSVWRWCSDVADWHSSG